MMKSKCLCKGSSSSDIISTLPDTILETILNLLSTKEAARTSILSREWRYKWTKIPKLMFHLSEVSKRTTKGKQVKGENMIRKRFYDLHQILLSLQGPIHEFTLDIDCGLSSHEAEDYSFGFDQIVLHLSKIHTMTKLTLCGYDFSDSYKLPVSVFSLHHLTDLYLSCDNLDHQQISNEFGSLTNLVLHHVGISTKTLLHLLSNCPSLKCFALFLGDSHIGGKCTIIELFECLPVIERLTIWRHVDQWLVLDSVPKELPTSLLHLKHFCFKQMCFLDGYGLAFLLVLIKCSPNLEKIKLEIKWGDKCDREYSVVWEEYSDVWLEHLTELEIDCFKNSKPEIELMKFILARSPKLKKVSIRSGLFAKERLEMLQDLLQAPCVSSDVIYV